MDLPHKVGSFDEAPEYFDETGAVHLAVRIQSIDLLHDRVVTLPSVSSDQKPLVFHFEPYTWIERKLGAAPERLGAILAPEASEFPLEVGDLVKITWKAHPLFRGRNLALRIQVVSKP